MTTVAYFGCYGEPGHYLFTSEHENRPARLLSNQQVGPWTAGKLDDPDRWNGNGASSTSRVSMHYVDGWTLMCMRDYSVDTRPGSHAIFLAEGAHTQDAMWVLAADAFPFIAARLMGRQPKVTS